MDIKATEDQEESKFTLDSYCLIDKSGTVTLSGVAAGHQLGHSINSQYSQFFAVFIGFSPLFLSFMISLRNFFQFTCQSAFGDLSDRFGRKPFLLIGLVLSTLMMLVLPYLTDPLLFLVGMIVLFVSIFYFHSCMA